MVLLRESGTHFAECSTESGKLCAWALAPGVFASQGQGHMTDEHCAFIEDYAEARMREHDGKLYVFHDWMELTGTRKHGCA